MVSMIKALYCSRAFFHFSRYTSPMQLILDLPDELFAALAPSGQDLSRAALEAIALQAYRECKLTAVQLRHLLGFASPISLESDGFASGAGEVLAGGRQGREKVV